MKKVVVGMSGGVDSAVAAYLLKEAGYEVIGLFMRNWDSNINNDILGNPNDFNDICPQEKDYNDAKTVCEKLGISLHRVDFIKEYWDYVFTYFLKELEKGRTPNPDMLCNKFIKFDLFIKEAKRLGADFIATGHYARIKNGKLLRAKDLNKDQTYFLADVKKENFKDVLFPIGDYTKPEIREIAKVQELIVADKKDSTGICFIGERNYQEFIKNYLKPNPGDIVNVDCSTILNGYFSDSSRMFMLGNVSEWTGSSDDSEITPIDRGGCYGIGSSDCKSSFGYGHGMDYKHKSIGFRLFATNKSK